MILSLSTNRCALWIIILLHMHAHFSSFLDISNVRIKHNFKAPRLVQKDSRSPVRSRMQKWSKKCLQHFISDRFFMRFLLTFCKFYLLIQIRKIWKTLLCIQILFYFKSKYYTIEKKIYDLPSMGKFLIRSSN